ncbi:MAG TPA: hypothetical protein VFC00_41085 [Micromonosporaceae bacterium]|nr:hypothetical protein [Micromonosporaceae bacterium]
MEREELVAQLATAVRHRDHWRLDGQAAVHERPGTTQAVRIVVPPQEGTARQRVAFRAIIIQSGAARFSRPYHTVAEAITWAEQVPLD